MGKNWMNIIIENVLVAVVQSNSDCEIVRLLIVVVCKVKVQECE